MSRRLPKIFSMHFLPEFFFENPGSTITDDKLEEKLQGAWQVGAEDSRELALQNAVPKVRSLDWSKAQGVLIELTTPQRRGESQAAVLSFRPGTNEARIYFLEKTDQGFALTSIDQKRKHIYHQDLSGNSIQTFASAARSLAEG